MSEVPLYRNESRNSEEKNFMGPAVEPTPLRMDHLVTTKWTSQVVHSQPQDIKGSCNPAQGSAETSSVPSGLTG
jgi:hypothetical protein